LAAVGECHLDKFLKENWQRITFELGCYATSLYEINLTQKTKNGIQNESLNLSRKPKK